MIVRNNVYNKVFQNYSKLRGDSKNKVRNSLDAKFSEFVIEEIIERDESTSAFEEEVREANSGMLEHEWE
jgi:hypothetical protein